MLDQATLADPNLEVQALTIEMKPNIVKPLKVILIGPTSIIILARLLIWENCVLGPTEPKN